MVIPLLVVAMGLILVGLYTGNLVGDVIRFAIPEKIL